MFIVGVHGSKRATGRLRLAVRIRRLSEFPTVREITAATGSINTLTSSGHLRPGPNGGLESSNGPP